MASWVDLGYPVGAGSATAIAASEQEVFLGTDDGLWRRGLDQNASWTRVGLPGRFVQTLEAVGPSVLLAGVGGNDEILPGGSTFPGSFARSVDGGDHWCFSGGDLFIDVVGGNRVAIPMYRIVRDPGTEGGGLGVLYAGMSGASIAVSIDGGARWRYVRGEPRIYESAPCVLQMAAPASQILYQGCEIPSDNAWINAIDVSSRGSKLGTVTAIVGIDDIGNRRPNAFGRSPASATVTYAGLEGGLLRIDSSTWAWVFMYPQSGTGAFGRYIYVRVIWVDPCDPAHVVFGGPTQAHDTFDLYETFDGGVTLAFTPFPPLSMPWSVESGVAAGRGGRAIVVIASTSTGPARSYRVLLRRYGP